MIKKSIIRVLPFVALLVFLLNRISLIENPLIRISGFSAAVIGFSVIYTIIDFFMYKKLNRNKSEHLETPFNDINEASERTVIEELVPVEEENDFGELLEVEDQVQQPVEFTTSVLETEPDTKKKFSEADLQENIEELEVLDESVEELEAIDE